MKHNETNGFLKNIYISYIGFADLLSNMANIRTRTIGYHDLQKWLSLLIYCPWTEMDG